MKFYTQINYTDLSLLVARHGQVKLRILFSRDDRF
jgi:uncharacterized beta-barrel protein YwiB (DUF1934 family)